jgi:membrane fusion protein (multidrug efflux system)
MKAASSTEPHSNASARSTATQAVRFVRRPAILVIAIVILSIGTFFGIRFLRFVFTHEETDDAQVEGDISPVLPRTSGYVARVLVKDNERVVAGQLLVEIDPDELDMRVNQASTALQAARAGLTTAEASLDAAKATVAVARANVAAVRVRSDKTASDFSQDEGLFKGGAITDRQLSDSRAASDAAAAQLVMAQREAEAAASQAAVAAIKVSAARAQAAEQGADLDLAKLLRSYANITAPISGLVAHKDVEPGQLVQAGQTLLAIASDTGVWVVANFKETQLTHIRPGQPATFTADSYPGLVFHGKVDSIAGATGARFALLPPDNATGNFVKVTQRVPVKIVLDETPGSQSVLRPGMSVDAIVDIKE